MQLSKGIIILIWVEVSPGILRCTPRTDGETGTKIVGSRDTESMYPLYPRKNRFLETGTKDTQGKRT